jgi:phage/conjugal plasmid C-4 type zinc finger TraR family protein
MSWGKENPETSTEQVTRLPGCDGCRAPGISCNPNGLGSVFTCQLSCERVEKRLNRNYWESSMAGGWSSDGAVQDQIDATIEDAVQRARSALPRGPSLANCEACNEPIPRARREAVPGVRLCVACQAELDKKRVAHSGYNRRGSKDSQLR